MSSFENITMSSIRDWPQIALERPYTDVVTRERGVQAELKRIDDIVMRHEDNLIANAQDHLETIAAATKEVKAVTESLIEMAKAADRGEDVDLQEWERLDNRALMLTPDLDNDPLRVRVRGLIHDLEDPFEALALMMDKYPALRSKFI